MTRSGHVLTLKYLAGMFDHPMTDPSRVGTDRGADGGEPRGRADAADKSMVLLENRDHALPLSTSTPSIAVVGPLADDAADQLGPTCRSATTSPRARSSRCLDGIKAADPNATVTTARGCDTACTDSSGFGAAVSAAKAADVTVVVVGEPAADTGEASSRSDISLPGQQLALVQAIAATGKPYVVVLMNGRPLTIGWLADNAPALLEAWYPGTEGGDAVADVLFGKVDPGRQAADVVPAQRRSDPDLLQRAADGPARSIPTTSTRRSTSTSPTPRSTRSATGCRTRRSRSRTCTVVEQRIPAQRLAHSQRRPHQHRFGRR